MWTVPLIKSVCGSQWCGWCREGSSDKIYISMHLSFNGKSTTFNMYQRRGAFHLTVDEFSGNLVGSVGGKKSGKYNKSVPVLDYNHVMDLFCEYLNNSTSTLTTKNKVEQKKDGEYYLWKLKDGHFHGGFDKGIEYWGDVGVDALRVSVKMMNRNGEWVFLPLDIITPSLTTD